MQKLQKEVDRLEGIVVCLNFFLRNNNFLSESNPKMFFFWRELTCHSSEILDVRSNQLSREMLQNLS